MCWTYRLNRIFHATKRFSHVSQLQLAREEIILQKVTVGQDGSSISVVCLNRPKFKNALSLNLVEKFRQTVDCIRNDNKTRVVILRSLVPNAFCSGADLKERNTFTQAQVVGFLTNLNILLENIEKIKVPVIVALDGVALGGGLEISLACDIRIASDNVKLGLVEVKLGIIPGAGGTQRLPRLINPSIAKELIFTGRILKGEQAYKLGIINHLVIQNEEGNAAFLKSVEIGKEISENGPLAVEMAKTAINTGLQVDLNTALQIEKSLYAQLLNTKDRVEGFTAFIEKRKPTYIGE